MKEPEKASLLVIEDEIQIRRLLRVCLERNGYRVFEAATGEGGIDAAIQHQPQITLLDLGLPDIDGLAVLKRLREWNRWPILIVSVRGREEDKIGALDAGANDYITKPFSTGELLARLRVVQRYAFPHENTQQVFTSGYLTVDLATRTVKVQDRVVKLTATEYSLLSLFVQHAGKVLTHGQLLREIWGSNDIEKTGPLRVYMGYLREKLETNPAKPQLLITEPGVGYRLV
ncbi:MAG TPA: response regulator, partial [Patescibacteria group bacterium]|nr:response regulator [Patescibacteria group bacterium]